MQKGVLSKREYDALMELFESAKPVTETEQPSEQPVRMNTAPDALRSRYDALASEWAKSFFAVTGQTAYIRLRTIVKKRKFEKPEDEVVYRCGEHTCLVCPAPLINYINEQRLGAYDQIPQLMHPLTQIDMLLFEQTAAVLFHEESMTLADTVPEGRVWIEAGFDLEIAPYLRTTFRWLHDESL